MVGTPDEMDSVEIATTGNAIDFGEITVSDRFRPTGLVPTVTEDSKYNYGE